MNGLTMGLDAQLRAMAQGLDADEVAARVWWSILGEPGDRVAWTLVGALGAPRAARAVLAQASPDEVRMLLSDADSAPELGDEDLARAMDRWSPRVSGERFAQVVRSSRSLGLRLLTPGDVAWPGGLRDLGENAPLSLWTVGTPDGLRAPMLAVVGARASTAYGEHVTAELIDSLPPQVGVLSGGAYGVDGAAHRAALASEHPTVAVLAGGLDRLYPSGHEQLFARIRAHGGLLASEVPVGTTPSKWRFLARNRLIAAAAAALLVVEAGSRSGAINSAHHAAQLGRPLGAVPGPITSAASAGCHRLIRDGLAECVANTADLHELLGVSEPALFTDEEAMLTPLEMRVRDALAVSVQRDAFDVARRAGTSFAEARAALGSLELGGAAERRGEGWVLGPSARTRRG